MLLRVVCFLSALCVIVEAAPMTSKKCFRETGGILGVDIFVEIPAGDPFDSITFNDGGGQAKTATCSTTSGQITGAGVANDPYTITIRVNPAIDPLLGTPDCGHTRVGEVYTWVVSTIQTPCCTPFPLSPAKTVDQNIVCDYSTITENPGVNVQVNGSGDLTTVELVHTSIAVELSLVKDTFAPFLPTDTVMVGDVNRLSVRAIDEDIGVYMSDCMACNTPSCDDIVFPMLDSFSCETSIFTSIVDSSSLSEAAGSFMLTQGGFNGTAFTRGYSQFRFVASTDVYFRCNLGYCFDPDDMYCTNRCAMATGRRKRDADRSSGEWTTLYVRVEGDNSSFILGSPLQSHYTGQSPTENVKSCFEKAEYISILSVLGAGVVASGVVAIGLGRKVSQL